MNETRPKKSNAVELVAVFGKKSRVDFHTVAALILTHRYEVSSRQRSYDRRRCVNNLLVTIQIVCSIIPYFSDLYEDTFFIKIGRMRLFFVSTVLCTESR